jgi:hypothetical protein
MLRFDDITIEAWREPPRPLITTRERIQVHHPAAGSLPEYVEDWGLRDSIPVRFVSSERQGILTREEVIALRALYESGEAFELETDLLDDIDGGAQEFIARFTERPSFTPATPGGIRYYMDLSLVLAVGDGGS